VVPVAAGAGGGGGGGAAAAAPVQVGAPLPKKFWNTETHMPELNPEFSEKVTLLDGELTVESLRYPAPVLTYYVFDSIIVHGRSVQDLTLADRLKMALNCVVFPRQVNSAWAPPGPGSFRIMMKEMFRVRTPGATE
jgi:hypothetical protein